jgi:hypothetical protein
MRRCTSCNGPPAPLYPTEGVWSHVKRSLGNLATTGVDRLATIVRNRLKRIQYRPNLLTSCLTHRPGPLLPDRRLVPMADPVLLLRAHRPALSPRPAWRMPAQQAPGIRGSPPAKPNPLAPFAFHG